MILADREFIEIRPWNYKCAMFVLIIENRSPVLKVVVLYRRKVFPHDHITLGELHNCCLFTKRSIFVTLATLLEIWQ